MIRQFKALWERRHILIYLVISELKRLYRNKVLGYLWSLLDPLCMMAVYVLLVVFIFQRGGPQFPVLLFSALLAWWWFVYSVSSSVTSIAGKAKLIQSVYFPKAILPLEKVLVGLVRYLLGLIVLAPLLLIFEANITINVLWLPVLILVQLLFTAGCSFFFAALGVYFSDLQNVVRFLLRAWFFLSPALYLATERIPQQYQAIYMLNPFAALFTSYKNILVFGLPPNEYMLVATVVAVVIFLGGFAFFTQREPAFAKAV